MTQANWFPTSNSPFPTSACLDLPCVPWLFPTFVLLDAHSIYLHWCYTVHRMFTFVFLSCGRFSNDFGECSEIYCIYIHIYTYTSQCIIYIYIYYSMHIYIHLWKSHVCLYMFIHVLSGYGGFPKLI